MRRRGSQLPAWTGKEIRTLVRIYPTGGAKACMPDLPGRSLSAIYTTAQIMGVTRTGVHRGRKAAAR